MCSSDPKAAEVIIGYLDSVRSILVNSSSGGATNEGGGVFILMSNAGPGDGPRGETRVSLLTYGRPPWLVEFDSLVPSDFAIEKRCAGAFICTKVSNARTGGD